MRHIKLFTQMVGCALVLIMVDACSTVAPTPARVPAAVAQPEPIPTTVDTLAAAPTAAVAPTREATVTSAPLPEPQASATRVLEPSGITLVYVPGGEFTMGSLADDTTAHDREKPAHTVYVDGYWMGQTEVTNEQYARFMEAGGYSGREYWTEEGWQWKEDNGITEPSVRWSSESFNAPQQPVVGVGWHEAAAFAKWVGGRLPTEAEWEYAARGGPLSKGYRYAGSDDVDDVAWYYETSDEHTEPVGGMQPNELGLYDMSGNAWEWCSDWYDGEYYAESPRDNPKGPESGDGRVARGGYCNSGPATVRCASRYYARPDSRGGYAGCGGIRVVVAP